MLAAFLSGCGRLPAAKPLYMEALRGFTRLYGPTHAITTGTMMSVADLLADTGRHKEVPRLPPARPATPDHVLVAAARRSLHAP